jgi:UTP--glucose-1-phosphate uridylyltransferase
VKQTVRTAVFPAAGLGTRFLPATKTMPKEMLPLVDKPIIQYAVEEAVASGIEQVILVTARGKTAMVDHFDVDVELETFLEDRGKIEQLAAVRHASTLVRLGAIRQGPPLGLGHAVLITKDLVGDQPFAVVLGDDVIDADPPAIRQLIDVFDKVQGPVLAVERVPMDQISRYGVVDAEPMGEGIYRIKDLIEKPTREEAPSDLGIIGRYVLTPDIFDVLANVREDRTGEIQLTNGLRCSAPTWPSRSSSTSARSSTERRRGGQRLAEPRVRSGGLRRRGRRRGLALGTAGRAARLLGVVGDVPARALELDRRRRKELGDRTTALRAHLHERVRELLDHLEAMRAGVTLVFVEWHGSKITPTREETRETPTTSGQQRLLVALAEHQVTQHAVRPQPQTEQRGVESTEVELLPLLCLHVGPQLQQHQLAERVGDV